MLFIPPVDPVKGFRHGGFVTTFVESNPINRLGNIRLRLISVSDTSSTSTKRYTVYTSFTVYSRKDPPQKSYHYSFQTFQVEVESVETWVGQKQVDLDSKWDLERLWVLRCQCSPTKKSHVWVFGPLEPNAIV